MPIYSFSQIQTFVQCPRKYQYKYVDNIQEKEFESSPDLILGNSVHAALEWLYNQINLFNIPTKDELLIKFKEYWDSELQETTQEKSLEMKGEQTLEDYIRRGLHYVANYYDHHQPFEKITVVATEAQIIFNLNNQITFRGFIDRLDKEEDTFIINDYKTNKNLPPESKEEYIEQLTLYGLGVQQNYAKYFKHLKARIHYLHFDLMDEREITEDKLGNITKKYIDIITDIESKKFAYNMGDKYAFLPKENTYCKYCEYYSICPLFAHLKFDDEVIGSELGEKTVKELVDTYVELSKKESEIKHQKELIKPLLIDYLEQHDILKLFGNTGKISVSKQEQISIKNKEKIKHILKELGVLDQVMEVDRHKIHALLKERKISLDQLQGNVTLSTSRTLKPGNQ